MKYSYNIYLKHIWLRILKYSSAYQIWNLKGIMMTNHEKGVIPVFLAHLAQSARWGIVRGLTPASCVVVRRQQLLQRSSSPKLLGQFLPNFTAMVLGWSSIRFLKIMTPGPKMALPGGFRATDKVRIFISKMSISWPNPMFDYFKVVKHRIWSRNNGVMFDWS